MATPICGGIGYLIEKTSQFVWPSKKRDFGYMPIYFLLKEETFQITEGYLPSTTRGTLSLLESIIMEKLDQPPRCHNLSWNLTST